MTTFMQKLRVVTLGSVNDLLDKAIDMNSPSALRQYVRDLEDALDKMRSEADVQAGSIRTMERESTDLQSKVDLGKSTIAKLQATGHEDLARIKATEVVQSQQRLVQLQSQLVSQRAMSATIERSVSMVEQKHNTMVFKLQELMNLDMNTKSSEHAAKAIQAAGRLVNPGVDLSVDDIEGRMRARNDVATVKLNRALGDVNIQEDPETTAAVDELLGSMKPQTSAASK